MWASIWTLLAGTTPRSRRRFGAILGHLFGYGFLRLMDSWIFRVLIEIVYRDTRLDNFSYRMMTLHACRSICLLSPYSYSFSSVLLQYVVVRYLHSLHCFNEDITISRSHYYGII
ncbi:hypothetical protein K505DRAFT_156709 [Melanomma pulvis-pyrius CBS 109.77]|uniref:Uncharacterized protein n=1 Tax=Melanomma pulvis-pyrius CBS 109.77 TaxID=1314802 RepID=A0A6A6WPV3_9PLEO|nr:hypothetical protein K505DRAFT_156709 [Melanomma pulvis-pyrius CBS 109.77]